MSLCLDAIIFNHTPKGWKVMVRVNHQNGSFKWTEEFWSKESTTLETVIEAATEFVNLSKLHNDNKAVDRYVHVTGSCMSEEETMKIEDFVTSHYFGFDDSTELPPEEE